MTNFISYAQNFEDVMLWRALKDVEKGCYIDLGAQDPVIDSVSLAFHERGWKGVHVEPVPRYAQMLRERRAGDLVIEAAVGEGSDLLTFYEIADSGISTVNRQLAHEHHERGFEPREITVPCVRLSAIFKAFAQSDIHWMKIDVEGSEKSALASWGKAASRPWIVVVESTLPMTQIESYQEWEPLLLKRGYAPVYFDGLNRFYVWDQKPELKKAFLAPPNVFDGFCVSGTASTYLHRHLTRLHTAALESVDAKVQQAAGQIERLQFEQLSALEARAAEQHSLENAHALEISAFREDVGRAQAQLARERDELQKALIESSQTRAAREQQFGDEFRKALDAMHLDALRFVQELSSREQEWEAQIAQRIEESHRALALAQQEFKREIDAVRRQVSDEKLDASQRHEAEVVELKEMASSYREEGLKLRAEIETLRQSEASLMGHWQVESEHNEQNKALLLSQLTAQRNESARLLELAASERHEVDSLRSSRSWRFTAPLRRLASLFSRDGMNESQFETCEEVPLDNRLNLDAHGPASPEMPFVNKISYSELTRLDGGDFVENCYWRLLHRAADSAGKANYLSQLQAGTRKASIIDELLASDEGRKIGAQVVHDDVPVPKGINGTRPSASMELGRALRAIDNQLQCMIEACQAADESVASPSLACSPHSRPGPVINLVIDFLWEYGSEEFRICSHLGQSFLATGAAVRFVCWNHEAKRFDLAVHDVLRHFGLKSLLGEMEVVYSASKENSLPLEPSTDSKDGWLLVPAPVCDPARLSELIDMNMILCARRLGLGSAYIFHGAQELRSPGSAGSRAEAHEEYMQALLLADLIVPVSNVAGDDLKAFFVQHQEAQWAPLIHHLMLPGNGAEGAFREWRDYANNVRALLAYAADKSHFLETVYFWIDPAQAVRAPAMQFARELARSLAESGIALIPISWDRDSEAIVSAEAALPDDWKNEYSQSAWADWIDPRQAGAPKWILFPWLVRGRLQTEIANHATSCRLRTATLLPGGESELDFGGDADLTALATMDKVFAASQLQLEAFERRLLAWRGKVQSAEHRFTVLAPPGGAQHWQGDSWRVYARNIAAELVTDRLSDTVRPVATDTRGNVYDTLVNLQRRPKLSICISTYNRAGWVNVNLRNIFAQIGTGRDDLEVLVVDNTSTDNTQDVVQRYLPRIDFRYVRNRTNVGMLGNLAVTAQRARGEYVWILGDDDLTRPGAIDKVLQVIEDHAGIALIYLNYGYTSEANPSSVTDIPSFLASYNLLERAGPDEFAPVKAIAAKCENFFTAIYSHVYRRDHALRSYCQDTSGRIFSTMLSCVPTAYYVLNYMADEPAYWVGEPALVVNSNVSWQEYGVLLELEQLPRTWDLAERMGTPADQVDRRRANRLWLVEMMWKEVFENDKAGNSAYFSPSRSLMRLKHLPEIDKHIPQFASIYDRAYRTGHPAASLSTNELFSAFDPQLLLSRAGGGDAVTS